MLSVFTNRNEPGFPQNFEVLRHGGLGQPECTNDVAHREISRRGLVQAPQNFASNGIGQYVKNVVHKKQGIPRGIPCSLHNGDSETELRGGGRRGSIAVPGLSTHVALLARSAGSLLARSSGPLLIGIASRAVPAVFSALATFGLLTALAALTALVTLWCAHRFVPEVGTL